VRKKFIYLILLFGGVLQAQHYQFSQFYAAQIYLNPAFTGANPCPRLGLNYRNQWSLIPGTFTSFQVSYDRPLRQINSGLGFSLFSDKAGLGSLKTTQFNALYAYELRINKGLVARAGLSAGFTQRSIDYSQLRFGDQIARGGAANSLEDISTNRNVYFDLNMGYLLYSKNAWGGFSINHLTRPNQSLQGGNSPLPIEWKFHGGYKFLLEEDASNSKEQHSITAAINYKKEAKFNQIDIGAYYTKGYMVVGMWYRGIPLYKPFKWYANNDALIFLLGVSTDKVRIGYSFDYTVSKLTVYNTNGTHEISIAYPFCSKKKRKKRPILISCPKF
jgi:type IX secretion system PorP/SprF family membrane protein